MDRVGAATGRAQLDIRDALIGLTVATAKRATTGLRTGRDALRPVVGLALRPPLLPARLQPVTRLQSWARAGAVYRLRTAPRLQALVPAAADAVLDRLDLTRIVLERLDLARLIDRIDMTALLRRAVDELDLPSIIRESSATMASEAVVGIRSRGMRADEGVNRIVDRVLQRDGARNTHLRPLPGAGDADRR